MPLRCLVYSKRSGARKIRDTIIACTVYYWSRYEREGLGGLTEGERSGRPGRLSEKQIQEINRVLRATPSDAGMRVNLWDGKTLSAWIEKTYKVQLSVRQCQRLFRQL